MQALQLPAQLRIMAKLGLETARRLRMVAALVGIATTIGVVTIIDEVETEAGALVVVDLVELVELVGEGSSLCQQAWTISLATEQIWGCLPIAA